MNGHSSIRGGNSNPGGAYIMAPNEVTPKLTTFQLEKSFYYTSKEMVHLVLDYDWCYMKINLFKVEKLEGFIQAETVMYPLDDNDKEYILVVKTDLNNYNNKFENLEFFTDTNGDLMIRRIKDYRFGWKYEKDEEIADNFYPVNSVISIKDGDRLFSIWNDRSQAATSYEKGCIYIVLNRKSSRDDKRGLADGLYENRNSKKNYIFKHYFTLGNNFNLKFIRNLVNYKPLTINIKNLSEASLIGLTGNLSKIQLKRLYFVIGDTNCLNIYYYPTAENQFLLQITNSFSDPYFTSHTICKFNLNPELVKSNFKIRQVELNGISKSPNFLRNFLKSTPYSSFRENSTVFRQFSLQPFETVNFILDYNS